MSAENNKRDLKEQRASAVQSLTHAQIAGQIKTEYGGLLGLVRRKLKDRELATDLVNEAIAITLEHARAGRLEDHQQVAGYVFKVAMNLLRNFRRNIDNREDMRADADVLETIPLYEHDEIESAQLKQKTRVLIESLSSARDREIVKRFYLDEEDKEAICQQLSLSPIQFTQVISRARQRIKQAFDSAGLKRTDFYCFLI